MVPVEIDRLFQRATRCSVCFEGRTLEHSAIDLAQPRWIGPAYWSTRPRVAIVVHNPGAGKHRDGRADANFRRHIQEYRDGLASIAAVFDHQRSDMCNWGGLHEFYMVGFGLEYDDVAFVNVAWCGVRNNSDVPRSMFETCYGKFTADLLGLLKPDAFILGGGEAHRFRKRIQDRFPTALIENVLHFSHRPVNDSKRPEQIRGVRKMLTQAKRNSGVDVGRSLFGWRERSSETSGR